MPAIAQMAEPADAPAARATDSGVEAKPDVFLLPDKNGVLQPVLGFTLEDFEALLALRAEKQLDQQRPRWRLDRLQITGTALPDRAELKVELTVFVQDEAWVKVPLKLGGAVLRDEVLHEGPGEQFLVYDDVAGEYVSWLHGQGEGTHKLTLSMLAALDMVQGESRLKLNVPRARSSELLLTVPAASAVGRVSDGAVLDSSVTSGETTQFKALGLAGDFSISWRKPDAMAAQVPILLEAKGAILATVNGPNLNSEAQLSVRSFGGEFRRFSVRLPAGADLVPAETKDYTIQVIDPSAAAPAEGRLVDVVLPQATVGPVTIKLNTQQVHAVATDEAAASEGEKPLELSGFEVIGAVRQSGHLAVRVEGDWELAWGARRQVRQIEDLPAELRREDLVAGFEYFAQPYSLAAQVTPREGRVLVEPSYQVEVFPDRLVLNGKLKYRVRGTKLFALELDARGWRITSIGLANQATPFDVSSTEQDAPLNIPLSPPLSGEFEVQLRAERMQPAQATQVDFLVPEPLAGTVGSAELVLLSANNVLLTPQDAELVNLTAQRSDMLPESAEFAARQQPPLFYRVEGPAARFLADIRVMPLDLSVAVQSKVTLADTAGSVEQTLRYTIAYEPVDHLTLMVPQNLADNSHLEVLYEGQVLPLVRAPEGPVKHDQASDESQGRVRMRLALPAAADRNCQLMIRYPINGETVPTGTSLSMDIPLVMPAAGRLTANEVIVRSEPGLTVQPRKGVWRVTNGSIAASRAGELALATMEPSSTVSLALHREDQHVFDGTIIERAWIQSWLGEQVRQDRAVYQFRSRDRQLRITLPVGADDLEVILNGDKIPLRAVVNGELLLPLVKQDLQERQQLELTYHFSPRTDDTERGKLSLTAPRLASDPWIRRLYWQVILPRHEHLLDVPNDFTAEFTWGWRGFYWGRRPLLEQADLETWSGASHATEVPSDTNRYLFSSLGGAEVLELRSSTRALIVLGASGVALVVGLIFIYLPASRRAAVLMLLILVALAGVALIPETTLLLCQAALLGLALALVAGWLEHGVARRRRRPVPIVPTGPSLSGIARPESTRTHYRPASSMNSTEAAADAVLPMALPESKP